jgi:hypothetical protein
MQKDWSIRQWDVVAAYLQALLHYDVYISDVNENGETEFWKLNKALYGLKQVGHEWYKTLQKILAIIGLHQYTGDEGTYTNKEKNIIIGTHVDDLVGIAPNDDILDTVQHKAEQHIELEIRGWPTKLLEMEVLWNEDGTEAIIIQHALIESMATKYLSEQITRKNSLPLNPDLYQEGAELLKDPKEYQSITGGLLFIARMTRPDISFHVNLLGQRAAKPSASNYKAAIGILQHLVTTKPLGIALQKPTHLNLNIDTDASYGGEGARSQTDHNVGTDSLGRLLHCVITKSPRSDVLSNKVT